MWVAKLKWKHDCIIGNRCKKYNVVANGIPLEMFTEKNKILFSHMQVLSGDEFDTKKFIADLKKDRRIRYIECSENTVFFTYEIGKKENVPTTHYSKKIFFIKPVHTDTEGYENWEIASWKKEHISEFIHETKKETNNMEDFRILKIEKSKLDEMYFPQLMPKLTKIQRRALEIAIKEDYYNFPRGASLRELAAQMGISLATYREHLRKAEKYIMPSIYRTIDK
jgi:predicted DNA binding protein